MTHGDRGAGFADHFSGHADAYAAHRPGYPKALFASLSELLDGPKNLALDCACGNGQASVGLAEYFSKVIATDASSNQIANAIAHPNIDYRCAAAEDSGLPDASVDMVCVAQALHWFDHPKFFAEARRVLRVNGVLACWAYQLCSVSEEIDAIIMRLYEDILGSFWPPERDLVENQYSTLGFPQPVKDVPAISMRENWTVEQMLAYLETWSALQRCNKASGKNALLEISADLHKAWGHATRTVDWPLLILAWEKPA